MDLAHFDLRPAARHRPARPAAGSAGGIAPRHGAARVGDAAVFRDAHATREAPRPDAIPAATTITAATTAATERVWPLALRGAVALVFAALALVWPGPTLLALAILWGAYALLDGVFHLVEATRLVRQRPRPRGTLTTGLMGLVGVGAGIAALAWPPIAALSLILLVAFWAVASGLLQIRAAVRGHRTLRSAWLLALGGAVTTALGFLIVAYPRPGVLVMMWMMAGHAAVLGVVLLATAWRARRRAQGADTRRVFTPGSSRTGDPSTSPPTPAGAPRPM